MLQVHLNNESLWVASAKFEMEEAGNAENARNIMLEALRFHPESSGLYREVGFIHGMKKKYRTLATWAQTSVTSHSPNLPSIKIFSMQGSKANSAKLDLLLGGLCPTVFINLETTTIIYFSNFEKCV